jgi:hypothetical protein
MSVMVLVVITRFIKSYNPYGYENHQVGPHRKDGTIVHYL